MLSRVGRYCSFHLQAIIRSLESLWQKPLSTLLTVMVIAISLTLPALFWVLTDNLSRLLSQWHQNGQITLYLQTSLTPAQHDAVLSKVRRIDGIGDAILKTPEQGLKELQVQEGMNEIINYLPENPLPAVIEVIPAVHKHMPSHLEQLFIQLKKIPEVEQAKLDRQWINRLHIILNFAQRIAKFLLLLLAIAVILIIGNTLRLAIHNRHEEIQVLKLIGATDPFITRPFLYTGIWYALSGALMAIALVHTFLLGIRTTASQLAAAYQISYPLQGLTFVQAFLLLFFAVFLGWMGACLSVRRELASIEPCN